MDSSWEIDRNKYCFEIYNHYNMDGMKSENSFIVLESRDYSRLFTHYERFLFPDRDTKERAGGRLSAIRAEIICDFLNFVFHKRGRNEIAEITRADLVEHLKAEEANFNSQKRQYYYVKDEKTMKNTMVLYPGAVPGHTIDRRCFVIIDFLKNYYRDFKDSKTFSYAPEDFPDLKLSISRETIYPLMFPYFKVLKDCAFRHDRMLWFALTIQACSGMEGSRVTDLTVDNFFGSYYDNKKRHTEHCVISCTRIPDRDMGYIGIIGERTLYHRNRVKKAIETRKEIPLISRRGLVFCDGAASYILHDLKIHGRYLRNAGYSLREGQPLFPSKPGEKIKPAEYERRLYDLFYDHFLPELEEMCRKQDLLEKNQIFIDSYKKHYPGKDFLKEWYLMAYIVKNGSNFYQASHLPTMKEEDIFLDQHQKMLPIFDNSSELLCPQYPSLFIVKEDESDE